jgi:hypothetical protein
MPPVEDIALRVPSADEMSRLREYLPAAFLPGGSPSWLIAERKRTSEFLAVWCLLWTNVDLRQAGFFWRIDHPDLGAPMMQRMLQAAAKAGIRRLVRMQMIWEDSPERSLLESNGFRATDEVRWYEGKLSSIAGHVEPVFEALRRRNRLPELEITGLSEENIPAVRELVVRHRLVPDFEFPHKCAPGPKGYDRKLSFALTQGEHVKGAFLATVPEPSLAEIDVRVIDGSNPHLSFGANAMLLHEACRRGVMLGIERGRFRSHAVDHRETANLAARSNAKFFGRQCLFAREV